MYKIIIADDEPKIRRGLKNLKWDTLGIEVVGEASNGQEALDLVKNQKPDIALVDINMPIMNGLELIQAINSMEASCMVIIISGYDEFEYAREAIKQGVFEYILKPVDRRKLFEIIKSALESLDNKSKQDRLIQWANKQVEQESDQVVKQYFKKWIAGTFNDYEIDQNQEVLGLNLQKMNRLLMIKLLPVHAVGSIELDSTLQEFCIINIVNETMEAFSEKVVVGLEPNLYVVCYRVEESAEHKGLEISAIENISANLTDYLSLHCLMESQESHGLNRDFALLYQKGLKALKEMDHCSPIVQMAMEYINNHYHQMDLSIDQVAKHVRISTSHLSKQLRKELGVSYTDLVTKVRIEAAVKLMKDPMLRIYDIAEKVGYSTQHYFSAAFKKVMGASPAKYRKDHHNG